MMNRIGFAELIGYISANTGRGLDINIIKDIDQIINASFDQPELAKVPNVACEAVDNLMQLMNEGTQKIEAIKAYRLLTSAGLKESKDAVERYWVAKKQVEYDTKNVL